MEAASSASFVQDQWAAFTIIPISRKTYKLVNFVTFEISTNISPNGSLPP